MLPYLAMRTCMESGAQLFITGDLAVSMSCAMLSNLNIAIHNLALHLLKEYLSDTNFNNNIVYINYSCVLATNSIVLLSADYFCGKHAVFQARARLFVTISHLAFETLKYIFDKLNLCENPITNPFLLSLAKDAAVGWLAGATIALMIDNGNVILQKANYSALTALFARLCFRGAVEGGKYLNEYVILKIDQSNIRLYARRLLCLLCEFLPVMVVGKISDYQTGTLSGGLSKPIGTCTSCCSQAANGPLNVNSFQCEDNWPDYF